MLSKEQIFVGNLIRNISFGRRYNQLARITMLEDGLIWIKFLPDDYGLWIPDSDISYVAVEP